MSAKPEITIPVSLRDLAALHKLSSKAITTGDAIDALCVKAAVRRILQPALDALDAIDPAITVKFWHEHCTMTPLRECDACAQTARVATQRPARKAEARERAAAQPWDEEEAA